MFSTLQTGHLPLARRRLRASLAAGVMLSLYAHADSVPVYTEYSALTAGSLTRGEFGTSLAVIDDKLFVGAPAADFSSRSVGDGGGGGTINDSGAVSLTYPQFGARSIAARRLSAMKAALKCAPHWFMKRYPIRKRFNTRALRVFALYPLSRPRSSATAPWALSRMNARATMQKRRS